MMETEFPDDPESSFENGSTDGGGNAPQAGWQSTTTKTMEREPEDLGATSEILPLALPKGVKRLCELCRRTARLQCNYCRVTFYCDAEHQQADWVGIHKRICQLLVPIRTSTPSSILQSGQAELQLKKAELSEICRLEARSKLSAGKHYEALPAAHFYLHCSMDIHGHGSIELVPAYLLLSDVNMGLGNLTQAKELLSQAEWVVTKNPHCGHAVHQQLNRSLGHLYTVTGNLEAAVYNFANDVYHASEEYGLDSTVTCKGYFLMAGVFVKQEKMPIAHSLYSEVARIWQSHLTKLLKNHIQSPDTLLDSSYEKSQQVEVEEMLRTMLEFEQDSRKDSVQIALATHCLAMLWFLRGDCSKALGFGSKALQASQQRPNHDLTKSIQDLLQLVQSRQTDPHPGSD